MALPHCTLAVFDTETTGFVPKVHHVIEFASMRTENGAVVDTWESLFSAPHEIPDLVQVLTRIRPSDVVGKPACSECIDEIASHLEGADILVGQNLAFDLAMMKGEGLDLTDRPWIDTSLLAALVFPEFRSYSLPYMSAMLHLDHAPAHRALGDVRATMGMLEAIWDRLCMLQGTEREVLLSALGRSSTGYRLLAECLPAASQSGRPSWLSVAQPVSSTASVPDVAPPRSTAGTVTLLEQSAEPLELDALLASAMRDEQTHHWFAVKNVDATLSRSTVPQGVRVLHPPSMLLNPHAVAALEQQSSLTPEEALLLIKIQWFSPRTMRDIAVHGGEKDVWNGKLACSDASEEYRKQFQQEARITLCDHRQLLHMVEESTSAEQRIPHDAQITADDATMLEDTATRAWELFCSLDDLRAAAAGDEALTRLTDVVALWVERLRDSSDACAISENALRGEDASGIRERLGSAVAQKDLPDRTLHMLRMLQKLFTPGMTDGRVAWCERRYDGKLTLQAAPLHVDLQLRQQLFDRYAVTLLCPPQTQGNLPGIVPKTMPSRTEQSALQSSVPLIVPEHPSPALFDTPPQGKTILLVGSKRMIEQLYVKHTESLEARGITLVCQGMNGGMGRMESEFLAAEGSAIMIMTPFFYEGSSLPPHTVDRLIVDTIPFDHPNHTVLSARKQHMQQAFTDYLLPRAEFRLFRLLRSFCRHRTDSGELWLTDSRVHQKEYGAHVLRMLQAYTGSTAQQSDTGDWPAGKQMPLF